MIAVSRKEVIASPLDSPFDTLDFDFESLKATFDATNHRFENVATIMETIQESVAGVD